MSTPTLILLAAVQSIIEWDWKDVRALKVALEGIRDSNNSLLKADLPGTIRD